MRSLQRWPMLIDCYLPMKFCVRSRVDILLAKPAPCCMGPLDCPLRKYRGHCVDAQRGSAIGQSAVLALGEFSEQPAIDELKAIITSGKMELVPDAAEALATSRYRQHQDVLLQLLKDVQPERRDPILTVLSATPRPPGRMFWQTIRNQPQGGIRTEVLSALVVLGHPAAQGLLEEAIRSDNATTRKFAFDVLSRRSDRKSRNWRWITHSLRSIEESSIPCLNSF